MEWGGTSYIGCLGGAVEKTGKVVTKLIEGERRVIKIVRKMQQIVLLEGETIIRKVLSELIQSEYASNDVATTISGNVFITMPLFSLKPATNQHNNNINNNNNKNNNNNNNNDNPLRGLLPYRGRGVCVPQ